MAYIIDMILVSVLSTWTQFYALIFKLTFFTNQKDYIYKFNQLPLSLQFTNCFQVLDLFFLFLLVFANVFLFFFSFFVFANFIQYEKAVTWRCSEKKVVKFRKINRKCAYAGVSLRTRHRCFLFKNKPFL